MSDEQARSATDRASRRTRRLQWTAIGLAAVVVVALIAFSMSSASGSQTADIGSQGTPADPVSVEGASLQRARDGVRVRTEMPTPTPGSYEYPTPDMIPPGAPEHPELLVGGPETFTLWIMVFNYPDRCTDACNADDLEPESAAKGGVYQGDGRIADTDQMVLEGAVRVGQEPVRGTALENPLGAVVHVAIAPHGKALDGEELRRQLNGPIGNVGLWWGAEFPAP